MKKLSKKELRKTRNYRANEAEDKAMKTHWKKSNPKLAFSTWIVWYCSGN